MKNTIQFHNRKKTIFFGLASLITSFSITSLLYKLFLQFPLLSKRNLALGLLIFVIATPIIYFILNHSFLQAICLQGKHLQIITLVGMFAFSTWIYFNFSLGQKPIYLLLPDHTLEITLPIESLPQDQDVTLSWFNVGFRDISFSELEIEGNYSQDQDGYHFPAGQTAKIHWKGKTGNTTKIAFQSLPFTQDIFIKWDEMEKTIHLNSSIGFVTREDRFDKTFSNYLTDFILIIPGIYFFIFLMAISISFWQSK